jgi:hypothetical protein
MNAGEFRSEAADCLGQNKPAGDLVDCVSKHFPDVDVYRQNDDLVIKGGGRFLIVRRAGPDLFRVSENVAVPSASQIDAGGGADRTMNALIDEILTLDD